MLLNDRGGFNFAEKSLNANIAIKTTANIYPFTVLKDKRKDTEYFTILFHNMQKYILFGTDVYDI